MKKKFLLLSILFFCALTGSSQFTKQTNPLHPNECYLRQIKFVSAQEGWIDDKNAGRMLHTLNGGNTWTVVTPFLAELTDSEDVATNMSWINSTHGWILKNYYVEPSLESKGAVVYRTTNGGTSWTKTELPAVTVNSSNAPYAIKNSTALFPGLKIKKENASRPFHSQKVSGGIIGDYGAQLQFANSNVGWASVLNASAFNLLKTTDGGTTWNRLTDASIPIGIFHFIDANNGWIIGNNTLENNQLNLTKIYRTTNGGQTWTLIKSGDINYEQLVFTTSTQGWARGFHIDSDEDILMKTTDGGLTWSEIQSIPTPEGFSKEYYDFHFLDSDRGFVDLGVRDNDNNYTEYLCRTTDGGNTWTQFPLNATTMNDENFDELSSMYFTDINNGWMTSYNGGIYRFQGESTSTSSIEASKLISLSSSLVSDLITIKMDDSLVKGNNVIQIISNSGATVYSNPIVSNEHTIHVDFLPKGVYLIKVGMAVQKFVIY